MVRCIRARHVCAHTYACASALARWARLEKHVSRVMRMPWLLGRPQLPRARWGGEDQALLPASGTVPASQGMLSAWQVKTGCEQALGCGRVGAGSPLEGPKSHAQIRILLDTGAATASVAETCSRGGGAVTGGRGAPRVLELSKAPLAGRKRRKGKVARCDHGPIAGEDGPFLPRVLL